VRDGKRIDRMLGLLRTVWHEHPDWRLGQTIVNLYRETGAEDSDPFYLEDDALESILRLHTKK